MKRSLCYSKSIHVHFKLSEFILQELQIFSRIFTCVYTKKVCLQLQYVTWKIVCHWLLAPPMTLQCGLKHPPCSTEWIGVYYKHTCGNVNLCTYQSFAPPNSMWGMQGNRRGFDLPQHCFPLPRGKTFSLIPSYPYLTPPKKWGLRALRTKSEPQEQKCKNTFVLPVIRRYVRQIQR